MTTDTNPEGAQDEVLLLADAREAFGGSPRVKRVAADLLRLYVRVQELERELAAIGAGGVGAWITPEGDRVVTAATMAGAKSDGGAMLTSLKPYSIPLFRARGAQGESK